MIQKNFVHEFVSVGKEVESSEKEGGRFYITESGQFPSVTTVVGFEKQEFFKVWRRQNPEEAKRVTSRGSRLHSIIESYLKNESIKDLNLMPNDLDLFVQIKKELDNIDRIKALEFPLYGDVVGLAGRVDCVADYKGKLSIIDFKGSTRPKMKEDIENYMLQATAYTLLWKEMTGESIDNFVILITCEDGAVQIFEDNPMNYVSKLYSIIQRYKEHNERKRTS